MGEKTEQAILAGLAVAAASESATASRPAALRPFAERIVAELSALPEVDQCEIAGSLRRFTETVKDVDLVVATPVPAAVAEAFAGADWVADGRGARRHQGHLHRPRRHPRRAADGRAGGVRQPAAAPDRARRITTWRCARRRSRPASRSASTASRRSRRARCCAAATRPDVYERLGMDWVPPELRENRGEIEAARAHALPDLVTLDDIRGDLHSHTDWSDGKLTLEQLVEGAAREGLRLPERDRPLARGRLRHGARRRPAARADRAGARAGRDAGRLHAAGRRRGGHPQGRLARLLGRADGRAGRGGGQPARLAPAQRGRPDQAAVRGHGEPARRHDRPPHRPHARPPRGRTRWTWRR